MFERILYKTKLCVLYQRGRCSRPYCNFAHGSEELRLSFNGRQDPRGDRDLRDRLHRRRSPSSNSLGREDARWTHSSHGDSPRSGRKRMDKIHKKIKQLGDHTDHSGRIADENDDQINDRKSSSDSKLTELQSEIMILDSKKRQLEIYLEDKSKDVEHLMVEIHELEMQLAEEKVENKRMTSKIKKFIKAHNRHLGLQGELKRSQAQFKKLAEQLELDYAGSVFNDEPKMDPFTYNASGERNPSPLNEGQMNSSPLQRRARSHLNSYDASNQAGEKIEIGRHRMERTGNHHQLSNKRKQESDHDAYDGNGFLAHEENSRKESQPHDIASSGKYKLYETVTLPSTGVAGHAVNEEIKVVESVDKLPVGRGRVETGETTTLKIRSLHPVPENAYVEYKGEDESVDIDGVDEEMEDEEVDTV